MIGLCKFVSTQKMCIISSVDGNKSTVILFKIEYVFNLEKTRSICMRTLATEYVCNTSSSVNLLL